MLTLFAELMAEAEEAGKFGRAQPSRIAAMTMQTVMFIAQSSAATTRRERSPPRKSGTSAPGFRRPLIHRIAVLV